MTEPIHDDSLERLIQDIAPGARLLRTWPLRGDSSAQMTPFEIALPGGETRKLVLRRSGDFYSGRDHHAAGAEFRLLDALQDLGVPAPRPFNLDQTDGEPAIPFIVIEYLDDETDYGPMDRIDAARLMADCLAAVHAIDGANPSLMALRERTIDLISTFS